MCMSQQHCQFVKLARISEQVLQSYSAMTLNEGHGYSNSLVYRLQSWVMSIITASLEEVVPLLSESKAKLKVFFNEITWEGYSPYKL